MKVKGRCVIIGASPEADAKLVRRSVRPDDHVICADGGLSLAQKAGIIPDLLIGDFDSGERPDGDICETVALPVKKDDTDTMYCARTAIERGFRDFLLLGMTGGRLDHTIANLCTLRYLAEQGAKALMLDDSAEIRVLMPGEMVFEGRRDMTFSVFPFGCESCCLSLEGFEYPLDRGVLSAGIPLGVSNVIISDRAVLTLHSGCAAVIVS
jgi:thiamine pyrophosphokinase